MVAHRSRRSCGASFDRCGRPIRPGARLVFLGELQKLEIDVAKSTVEKYRPKLRGSTSPSWTTFLKQHIQDIVAIDFFTVPAGAIASAVRADGPGPRSAPGASLAAFAGSVWIMSSSSTNAISNGFSVIIPPITTNGARTDPWRWIHPMVEPSIHPNWARSSSSQRSMAHTIITFGKPHECSGPTGGARPRSCCF